MRCVITRDGGDTYARFPRFPKFPISTGVHNRDKFKKDGSISWSLVYPLRSVIAYEMTYQIHQLSIPSPATGTERAEQQVPMTHFPKASTAAHARPPPRNASAHGTRTVRSAASHTREAGHRTHGERSVFRVTGAQERKLSVSERKSGNG